MQTIYIYNKNDLNVVTQIPAKSLKNFENDKKGHFPFFMPEVHFYFVELLKYPILDNEKIREQTKEELYKAGKYILSENEIFEGNKIKTVELCDCEYIENNQVKLDREKKIKLIKKELSELKVEYSEKEFLFQGKYWQKNREKGDRDNLTGIVVLLMATGQKEYDGWKVLDKDTREHVYLKLSLNDLKVMALHMQEQVTKAMKVESELIVKLNILSDNELKAFDSRKEYESLWS